MVKVEWLTGWLTWWMGGSVDRVFSPECSWFDAVASVHYKPPKNSLENVCCYFIRIGFIKCAQMAGYSPVRCVLPERFTEQQTCPQASDNLHTFPSLEIMRRSQRSDGHTLTCFCQTEHTGRAHGSGTNLLHHNTI